MSIFSFVDNLKCQRLFSGKNKKIYYVNLSFAESTQGLVHVKVKLTPYEIFTSTNYGFLH